MTAETHKAYIAHPITTEDFISNVRFQLENVEGWQMAFRDGHQKDQVAARVKAECLASAASELFDHLKICAP